MIGGSIVVTLVDGTVLTAKPLPGDIMRLERHFDVRFAKVAQEGMAVVHLAFMAWSPLRRSGQVTAEFDDWCDELAELNVDTLGAAVPTSPAP